MFCLDSHSQPAFLPSKFTIDALAHHSFVSHHDTEILFHEFGHLLHGVLSKNEYQHTSGTRSATDYVETISTFYEKFASDHRTLNLFAKSPTGLSPLHTWLT